ncbi:hypothetical protein V8E54_009973 [Elaphomyces granulatus]|jgi:hypothetical protein
MENKVGVDTKSVEAINIGNTTFVEPDSTGLERERILRRRRPRRRRLLGDGA